MSAGPLAEASGEPGITDGAVREQLARTLAGKTFGNAPRASRFLQYIVEKSLSEPGVHISEYELGTEVFEKDPKTFDPRIDNDVRVGATRLRERLRRYYESEGAGDPIRIELPTGGFRPVFHLPGVPQSEQPPAPAATPSHPRRWWIWALAGGLAAALAAAPFLVRWAQSRHRLPPRKHIAVLLFTPVNADPEFCRGLTITLTGKLTELERFQRLYWVVPATEVLTGGVDTVKEAKRRFGVNLAITGSVLRDGGQMRVMVSLNDTEELRQLSSKTLMASGERHLDLQDDVVRAVAGMLDLELSAQADSVLKAGGSRAPGAEHYYLLGCGHLERGPDNLDEAVRMFNAAAGRDPGYAPAHAGLGEAYLRKYDLEKQARWIDAAQESCGRALRINSQLAPVRVTLGRIAGARGRDQDAVAEYQRALAIDPSYFDAYQGLAKTLVRLEKSQEAEKAYRKAIDLRQGYWRGHKELGVFYYMQGRYAEAEACFLKAKDLAPENFQIANIYSNLGGVYIQTGRLAEAERMLLDSLDRKPLAEAYNNLAAVYYYQNRYDEAAVAMEEAVKLGRANPSILGSLARTYALTNRRREAREYYEKAIAMAEGQLGINRADAELLADLALLRAESGAGKRALEQIEEARNLAPENNYVLFRAVLVHEKTGDRGRALAAVREILRRGPLMQEIRFDPDLAGLRQDPNYHALVSGLPRQANPKP